MSWRFGHIDSRLHYQCSEVLALQSEPQSLVDQSGLGSGDVK